jgi:hypothetical protein
MNRGLNWGGPLFHALCNMGFCCALIQSKGGRFPQVSGLTVLADRRTRHRRPLARAAITGEQLLDVTG